MPAPSLKPVLGVTLVGSMGTAIGWSGVFFVTEEVHHYTERQNLMLMVVLGLTYAVAAFFCKPVTGWIRRLKPGAPLSSRGYAMLNLAATGLIALLPVFVHSEWALWVFAIGYIVLVGMFWPGIEAFLCAGRRGKELNRATGVFNLVWASAMLPGMWVMGPLLEWQPYWVMGLMTPVALVCIGILRFFPAEPGAHGEAAHEHPPELDAEYRRLLRLFRVCLIGSYVIIAALTPVLPHLMTSLGIAATWKPGLASVWMTTRLVSFFVLGAWHAWHGSRALAGVALALMAAGFLGAMSGGSVVALVAALSAVGLGVGIAYAAAIYYALEVGSTDVDAGSKHEAAIGLGYGIGPLVLMLVGEPLGWIG